MRACHSSGLQPFSGTLLPSGNTVLGDACFARSKQELCRMLTTHLTSNTHYTAQVPPRRAHLLAPWPPSDAYGAT